MTHPEHAVYLARYFAIGFSLSIATVVGLSIRAKMNPDLNKIKFEEFVPIIFFGTTLWALIGSGVALFLLAYGSWWALTLQWYKKKIENEKT